MTGLQNVKAGGLLYPLVTSAFLDLKKASG